MHADPKTAAALSFGFEREGTKVLVKDSAEGLEQALLDGCQLLIAGSGTKEEARKLLAMAQGVMMGSGKRVPVMYFGNAISRDDAIGDGANEFVSQPAFIRDVVTLAKLMATPTARRTQSISGELGEHFGLFYIVRALGTIDNTGVLSLIRGLRRGELRFYKGELTSAQLGPLHGLSALHQLLLWTNARFDLREERVVHRRQIPLSRAELLSDCDRFLSEIKSIADGLSPSAVLEPDPTVDTSELPSQVAQILALFDGKDSVADVIEDSPYRVFETLRVACRLTEQGFIRRSNQAAPKHLMHTALAIEEWLVGGDVKPSSEKKVDRPRGPKVISPDDSSVPVVPSGGKRRARTDRSQKIKKSASPPKPAPERNEQSWSDVLPSRHATEELAQVVPATAAAGEISVASSPSTLAAARIGDSELPKAPTRERLEETGGNESLSKIFIDESLGAVESDENLETAAPLSSMIENPSWDDVTSPAKALSDPETVAAIEEGRRLAKEREEKKKKKKKKKKKEKKRTGVTTEKLDAIPDKVSGSDDTPRLQVKAQEEISPTSRRRAKEDTKPAPMPALDAKTAAKDDTEPAAKADPAAKGEAKADDQAEAKADDQAEAKADDQAGRQSRGESGRQSRGESGRQVGGESGRQVGGESGRQVGGESGRPGGGEGGRQGGGEGRGRQGGGKGRGRRPSSSCSRSRGKDCKRRRHRGSSATSSSSSQKAPEEGGQTEQLKDRDRRRRSASHGERGRGSVESGDGLQCRRRSILYARSK
jgi:hypothetical protein